MADHRTRAALAALSLAFAPLPATAQDATDPPGVSATDETAPPPALAITGSAALASNYRFRGVSRSDGDLAVQGNIGIEHESGLHGGVWASTVSGWGGVGGADVELDLSAGYRFRPTDAATLDLGVTYYAFPGGRNATDFLELQAELSGTIGPATLAAGVAYAPAQRALGRWYRSGASAATGRYDDPGDKGDNLYLRGDASSGIPATPITARAHIGRSSGNPGLGPQGTSLAPTGSYWDWLLGVDYIIAGTPLTLGVAYVDTDISRREAAYLQPAFSKGRDGRGQIADAAVVLSLSAAF